MTKVWKQRLSFVAFWFAIATVGIGLAPSQASAAVNAYLIVSGVTGPSTSRPGAIDLLSFSFGVASGQKNFCSGPSVLKVLDVTSPVLAASVGGPPFSEVRIEYDKPVGDHQEVYFVLTFKNAQITSVQDSGSNENPTESVSFAPTSVGISFKPEKDDGTLGPAVTTVVQCTK